MSLEKITDYSFSFTDELLEIFIPSNESVTDWENGLQENSLYSIKISGLKTSSGKDIPEMSFEVLTPLSPMYCSLTSVSPVMKMFNVPLFDMLLYMRDASEEADFIEGGNSSSTGLTEEQTKFAKKQFVKTKVVLDCLVRGLAEGVSSGVGSRYKLDVAEIEEDLNEAAYKSMIADLRKDLQKWQDAIRGYYNEGRVPPKATRISLKSDSNQNVSHTTVDKIIDNISRTMPSRSD